MDSLNFHNIKFEKANAKLRYRGMQKITALFRLFELCIFFFIVSRFTTQLPFAFKLSGEYFRGLSVMAVSPRFVFIIGNGIVITLFLRSGKLSAKDSKLPSDSNKFDLYEEYVKNCEKNRSAFKELETKNTSSVKKQKKQSTFVNREVVHPEPAHNENREETQERKIKLHRSHSENPVAVHAKKDIEEEEEEEMGAGRKLRRSLTVRYRDSVNSEGNPPPPPPAAADEMSGEEFRRTVEAFIARQQRFLREEE